MFYIETLKALREDLHAGRKLMREMLEALRDIRDVGPVLKDIHDELVIAREGREKAERDRRAVVRSGDDRRTKGKR